MKGVLPLETSLSQPRAPSVKRHGQDRASISNFLRAGGQAGDRTPSPPPFLLSPSIPLDLKYFHGSTFTTYHFQDTIHYYLVHTFAGTLFSRDHATVPKPCTHPHHHHVGYISPAQPTRHHCHRHRHQLVTLDARCPGFGTADSGACCTST